jgi:UDP-2,4-diacetamido-2,4,6-trideoxy-beta-L-altropyranose hydrolase
MLIVFRTDASLDIGTGHVIRCLTLAEKLKDNGALVHFVCRTHEGHLCSLIEQRGFTVSRLSVTTTDPVVDVEHSHRHWLGSSWQEDAHDTSEILSSLDAKPAWLVVDHYALDHQWQKQQRALVDHLLVIDDLADREHDCDLLLDQNLVENFQHRYVGLAPDYCSFLLGPQYALLQPIYAELHDCTPCREGSVKRVLVFFGGADTANLTGLALKALMELEEVDVMVDVVVGRTCPHKKLIYEMAQNSQNVRVHDSLPSLAPLIAQADLAIGGGGTATWERLCLGLPSLVITLADNQKPIADILHRLGLIYLVGHIGDVKID